MTELETMRRAKRYMEKLAQGIDPITGEEITEDSVLNNVRLSRCFFYVSDVLRRIIDNGGTVGEISRKKREFSITPQQLASVQPMRSALRITGFMNLLYDAVGDPEMKRPNFSKFTDWLLYQGFLMQETGPDGKNRRVPTAAGRSIGIYTQMSQGRYGDYLAVLYDTNAQQFLLDHYWTIQEKK